MDWEPKRCGECEELAGPTYLLDDITQVCSAKCATAVGERLRRAGWEQTTTTLTNKFHKVTWVLGMDQHGVGYWDARVDPTGCVQMGTCAIFECASCAGPVVTPGNISPRSKVNLVCSPECLGRVDARMTLQGLAVDDTPIPYVAYGHYGEWLRVYVGEGQRVPVVWFT